MTLLGVWEAGEGAAEIHRGLGREERGLPDGQRIGPCKAGRLCGGPKEELGVSAWVVGEWGSKPKNADRVSSKRKASSVFWEERGRSPLL